MRGVTSATLGHAQHLLEELQHLTKEAESEKARAALEPHLVALRELLDFLVGLGVCRARPSSPATVQEWKRFGKLLRDKRNAAGLTRVQLAGRAKLSDATIKFVETSRHPPSRATLIRLIGVTDLQLGWQDVPGGPSAPSPSQASPLVAAPALHRALNCYLSTADPLAMVRDLGRFLQGAGGHIEQTNAYLEPQSAAAYLAMCRTSPTMALRGSIPLAKAAEAVAKRVGAEGVQVVALGAGDATLEVSLVQLLLDRMAVPDSRTALNPAASAPADLYLLDISPPLLSVGYNHAAEVLAGENVRVMALQANFHHLPQYTHLHPAPTGPRRPWLYCMLGGTLGNLDDELRFVQHSLVGCSPGDLLLFDVQVAWPGANDPATVERRDKTLAQGVSRAQVEWLAGPVWRQGRGVESVTLDWRLEMQCPVAGSYALEAVATIEQQGRPERAFSLFHFRRYDTCKLAECLANAGWELVTELDFTAAGQPAALMLFAKRGAS